MVTTKDKMLGSVYGAAYGDSFGAALEFCDRNEIRESFPKGYREYAHSISFITKGIEPGAVTDDFGSALYVMDALVRNHAFMSRAVAKEAILNWANDPVVFDRYAGPTSRAAIERLKNNKPADERQIRMHFSGANTNGGAMRVFPMGLLANGNLEEAVANAILLCEPTHYNSAAAAGAAAIACAVTVAMRNTCTLEDVFYAAVNGAKTARERLESEGFAAWGPYMENRIVYALERAENVHTENACIALLAEEIGTGIAVQESVAAVFAAIKSMQGDFYRTILCTANAGGDTDTVSSMAGAILGAFHGIDVIHENDIRRMHKANEQSNMQERITSFIACMCEE